MQTLALLGGKPVRTELFSAYNTIGSEEKKAVQEVLDSGNLSQFIGAWHADFYGGPKVRAFEEAWAQFVGAKHCISVNSNTSGLFAAIGALDIKPGDEVIVSPYTMSASAVAPLIYGGVPVFADVDENHFCISPKAFEKAITPRTKAILIVHIFGHPADMDAILAIAKKHNIRVIEDSAQAPYGTFQGKNVGVLGDIGVFSLNYHKHIHTGEGGMITTNDDVLAERLQLIRNHGENVVGPKGIKNISNTLGYNFRMPEIEAAIGLEQLKKLPRLIEERIQIAEQFTQKMKQYTGITPPFVRPGNRHVYYVHANKFDSQKVGIHRNTFVKALSAELPSAVLRETAPLIGAGYVKPLYLLPIYQQRAHPALQGSSVSYEKGICPTAERMHFSELFSHEFMRPSMSAKDIQDVFNAFDKVLSNVGKLKEWEIEKNTNSPS